MPSSVRARPLVVLLAASVVTLIAVIAMPRWIAAREEAAARKARAGTMPVEALARPRERREANAAALRLEQAAAAAGVEIAPRQSARVPAIGAKPPLGTLHADLMRLLAGESVSAIDPALREWIAANAAMLDALAVDLAGGEPPRWESPDEP